MDIDRGPTSTIQAMKGVPTQRRAQIVLAVGHEGFKRMMGEWADLPLAGTCAEGFECDSLLDGEVKSRKKGGVLGI